MQMNSVAYARISYITQEIEFPDHRSRLLVGNKNFSVPLNGANEIRSNNAEGFKISLNKICFAASEFFPRINIPLVFPSCFAWECPKIYGRWRPLGGKLFPLNVERV